MREGNELLQAAKRYAVEDRATSWLHLGVATTAFLAALAGTVWGGHIVARIAFSVLAGLVGVRMFILYHDHQHGAILRGSRFATAVMWIYGAYCLNPPSIWRRSHNYHHKHNAKIYGASIGSFPVMTVEDYAQASRAERIRYALNRHPLTILLGYVTIFIYGMCIRSLRACPARHWDSAAALLIHAALIVVLTLAGLDVLILTLLLPLMIMHAAGAYLFYAQHNFPDCELRPREAWDYVHAALRSSSYMMMGPVMHWFTGNIGYHHVHHLNPRIPFYRLPEVMSELPELQSPGTTSWRPRDVWACLRLKLWDAEKNRMVDFKGA